MNHYMSQRAVCMLLFALSLSLLHGQRTTTLQPATHIPLERVQVPSSSQVRMLRDTLDPGAITLQCAQDSGLTFYVVEDPDQPDLWGVATGTNVFGDRENALRYTAAGLNSIDIVEVWGFLVPIGIVGNGPLRAHVYETNGSGEPGTRVGTSSDVSVSDLDTSNFISFFPFSQPANVNGNDGFFVSIDFSDLYQTQDTLVVISTFLDCSADSGAYLRAVNDQWISFDSELGWGSAFDPMIGFVLEFGTTNLDEPTYVQQGDIRLFPPYQDDTQLQVPLQLVRSQAVSLNAYDSQGRQIYQAPTVPLTYGKQELTIDVTGWAAGVYTLDVVGQHTRLMVKFVVR